ncbi:MAG: HEAT repeat domain-containing protein [Limisphaerales bacterium]
MLQRLSDPDASVRLKTLEELDVLKLPEKDLVPLLTTCLADVDPRVRAFAALRLGSLSIAASDAVPALKHLAKMDSDELVRSRAKDALFNIRFYDFSKWREL